MAKKNIVAAGGIVWRNEGRVEVLLVHRPGYDDWSFPKGKVDPDETPRRAARREVAEETGYVCRLGPALGAIDYETTRGYPKVVHYWAMEATAGSFRKNSEVDDVAWLTPKKALKHLTYERDREFMAGLPDQWWLPKPKTLIIRHAEAGIRRIWTGDDRTRPLSPEGRVQAQLLREEFADDGLVRLLSSPYTRCWQTLEPLSAAIGVEIEYHEALAEGADPRFTLGLIESLSDVRAAICTHGDVITETMDLLARRGTVLGRPFETKKGSTWVLRPKRSGGFKKAKYLPPPRL